MGLGAAKESRTVTERKETSTVDSLTKPGPVVVAPAVLVARVVHETMSVET